MLNEQNILTDLLETIRNFDESNDTYFNHIRENQQLNPFQNNIEIRSVGINESIPVEFFAELGISSLTFNKFDGLPKSFTIPDRRDNDQLRWHHFKNSGFIKDIKAIFKASKVIAFSDWAFVDGASELWDGLLSDVIKPLNRKDFNFIFSLGDPTKKLGYEVDEILDIISDFSLYGQVTFLVNETDAANLWMVLYGQNFDTNFLKSTTDALKEKCRYIFNAMLIDRLLIYTVNHAMLFSKLQQFELKGRTLNNTGKLSQDVKDHFNTGYSVGLLLQLDISYCIALGLSVSGAYLESGTSPDREALLSYIKRWIGELEPA